MSSEVRSQGVAPAAAPGHSAAPGGSRSGVPQEYSYGRLMTATMALVLRHLPLILLLDLGCKLAEPRVNTVLISSPYFQRVMQRFADEFRQFYYEDTADSGVSASGLNMLPGPVTSGLSSVTTLSSWADVEWDADGKERQFHGEDFKEWWSSVGMARKLALVKVLVLVLAVVVAQIGLVVALKLVSGLALGQVVAHTELQPDAQQSGVSGYCKALVGAVTSAPWPSLLLRCVLTSLMVQARHLVLLGASCFLVTLPYTVPKIMASAVALPLVQLNASRALVPLRQSGAVMRDVWLNYVWAWFCMAVGGSVLSLVLQMFLPSSDGGGVLASWPNLVSWAVDATIGAVRGNLGLGTALLLLQTKQD